MREEKYTKEALEKAVKKAECFSDVCRFFNGKKKKIDGGVHEHIRNKIKRYKINIDHFLSRSELAKTRGKPSFKKAAKEILIKNRKAHTHANQLRRALSEIGRKYKCEGCGNIGNWRGEKLTLQIHHKNENNKDNRKCNLQFLCPNCHVQK